MDHEQQYQGDHKVQGEQKEADERTEPAPFLPWKDRGGFTGHWIKRAYTVMRRQLEVELRQLGLTHPQWASLGILYYYNGMTHSDLEQRLFVEAPSITSLIKGMEKKGWIERKQHPEDARVKQIYITDLGRKVIRPALELGTQGEEQLSEILSPQEMEQLKTTLRKIVSKLEG